MKRKQNPNQLKTEEIQTATLLVTEGYAFCWNWRGHLYPALEITMCDKEALLPAERVFGTRVYASKRKRIMCKPELFPPDGKGMWRIRSTGAPAKRAVQKLEPVLTAHFKKRWGEILRVCR